MRRSPGLRVQIVLALAGIILVAYVPLFFAIAQVARGTSLASREASARGLGRAIAAHVAMVARTDRPALTRTMDGYTSESSASAIAVFGPGGDVIAVSGPIPDVTRLHAPATRGETSTKALGASGRVIDVAFRSEGDVAVVVRLKADDDHARAGALVRGIALYMSVFALGLLVFAYIVLTRAIVRPIEELGRATDRVAGGARDLDLPSSGAREIAELGASVREMTARLLKEEQTLRDKIAELTTTTERLTKTREQLAGSEHMASVGRLAAGVAHEIGNPIAAIMGMHDLIDDGETSDDVRSDFLRRMRKETERIHTVIRDLLDYARPETGPASDRGSTSVAEVVDDTLNLVRPQKGFKEIEIRVEIDGSPSVALSPQRLTQVILNLLLNAGTALSQGATGHSITIRAAKDGQRVRIEVEDDGPGVPKEIAPRIFDPFVTTREVGSGTGLGLAVCQGIIEGAKGRIFLDQEHAPGARFVIELPAA